MAEELLIRCSSLGKIMTNAREVDPALMTEELRAIKAKTKRSDEEKALLADAISRSLSETAKTHIRSLAAQAIYGVEFEISSKPIEKGLELEGDAITLVNRVRGLSLVKNTERRSDGYLTGEADCFDAGPRIGHDTKVAWSIATFPIVLADCLDDDYLWQMRGYMKLWDAEEWHVQYALLDTPERLVGYEPQSMHFVSHIPEHLRLTTWRVTRDRSLEPLIEAKVRKAREYMEQVIAEFDRTHDGAELGAPRALQAQQAIQAPPAGPAGDGSQKPNGDGQDCPASAGSDVTRSEDASRREASFESAQDEGKECNGGHAEQRPPQAADAATAAAIVQIDPPPGHVEPATVLTVSSDSSACVVVNTELPQAYAAAGQAIRRINELSGPGAALPSAAEVADEKPTLKLGAINDWLAPIHLDAAGLALLGISHSGTDKAAKLYKPSDKARIKAALIEHLQGLQA